ncbi:hypothetical protein J7L67_02025 [bacterium]|nr:hypothetical protein [bacterium]
MSLLEMLVELKNKEIWTAMQNRDIKAVSSLIHNPDLADEFWTDFFNHINERMNNEQ